jgi:hypothetical protein
MYELGRIARQLSTAFPEDEVTARLVRMLAHQLCQERGLVTDALKSLRRDRTDGRLVAFIRAKLEEKGDRQGREER